MFAAYEMETNDLVISLALISLLTLATITDIHYFIIPNKLLSFFMGLFIIIRVLHPLDTWYDSLLGFLISYLLILLLIIISRGGMGAGDMKFLAVIGFLTGTKIALLGFMFAILLGGLYGFYFLIIKIKNISNYIHFDHLLGIGIEIISTYTKVIISYYY